MMTFGLDFCQNNQDMLPRVPTIHKIVTKPKLIIAWYREQSLLYLITKSKLYVRTVIHWSSLKLWKDITEDMMTDIYADMAKKSKEKIRSLAQFV